MSPRLLALAVLVIVVLVRLAASEAQSIPKLLDFEPLWDEAKRWAKQTDTVPEDCVFDFRLDPRTKALRDGHAVTCDEPYRSPFYPWPAPSRPGARISAEDIRTYAREFEAASPGPARLGVMGDDALYETCRLVVGFTAEGQGAEAIECHWREGGVRGQRANSGFAVEAEGRRVTSRLYDRILHLRDRTMGDMAARVAAARRMDTAKTVQVEGKVVGRAGDRLMLRGRARPVYDGSPSDPGVVATESDLVVEYPDDDALRPGYYFASEHCFKGKRETMGSVGVTVTEWIYGPCTLRPGQYWMFEQFPPGKKTVIHGPYAEHGLCERDRRRAKVGRADVGGHCERKAKAAFRMTNDGSLIVPKEAPSLD